MNGKRNAKEPEVFGAAEAAETLGVRQVNLRSLKGLPDPYGKVRATTLWRAEEIRALAQSREAEKTEGETDVRDQEAVAVAAS